MNSSSYITFMDQFNSGLYTEVTAKRIATNIYIRSMITEEEYNSLMDRASELSANTYDGDLIARIVSLETSISTVSKVIESIKAVLKISGSEIPEPDTGPDGSEKNPITAVRGMTYYKDKYYTDPDDNQVYICFRDNDSNPGTGIALAYLPHELLNIYFQK